jgi:four helix bundle protein
LVIEECLPMTPDELSNRLWCFAARIGKVVDALPDTRLGRHVAGQLVRSGTSAPPNYDEARVGESRADFAHKINVALKELVETRGWLKFITLAELLPARRIDALVEECDQLCRILGKSVATAKVKPKTGVAAADSITNAQCSILNETVPANAIAEAVWGSASLVLMDNNLPIPA